MLKLEKEEEKGEKKSLLAFLLWMAKYDKYIKHKVWKNYK